MDLKNIGTFEQRQFPNFRNATIDTLILGSKRHHIPLLLEVDVTVARQVIRNRKEQTGEGVSFTGWIVMCVAQAVSENKHIHALRKGKKRFIIFDDVDVVIVVERVVGDVKAGKTIPMPYLIRKANEKSLYEIHTEIRSAQTTPIPEGEVQIGSTRKAWLTNFYFSLPRFVRDVFFWQPMFRDPFRIKRTMGTVSVTALGMVGHGGISWGVPIGIHPLIVGVGGIAPRVILADGKVVSRDYLGLTVLFDHDVTDGAPVARFIRRLVELIESGYGLDEFQTLTEKDAEPGVT